VNPATNSGGSTSSPRAGHDGGNNVVAAGLFRQKSCGAVLDRPIDDRPFSGRGHQQHAGRQLGADHCVGHRDSVETRHLVVEQRNVRRMLANRVERRPAVAHGDHHFRAAVVVERTHQAVPVDRVIVADNNPHPVRLCH
jgi:hypothetical protein